jgi:hypothetical protein
VCARNRDRLHDRLPPRACELGKLRLELLTLGAGQLLPVLIAH